MLSLLIFAISANADPRSRIAIVDTGISLNFPEQYLCYSLSKDLTNTSIEDKIGHGTNIAGIIAKKMNYKKQCLIVIKWFDTARQARWLILQGKSSSMAKQALEYALNNKAKIINLSLSGNIFLPEELRLINQAVHKDVHVVVSAGNDGQNLDTSCDIYPACYAINHSNFHVVASYLNNTKRIYSNYGKVVTDKEDGNDVEGWTGTSQSAAKVTAKLVHDSL